MPKQTQERGAYKLLLAATTITANATSNKTPVTELDAYKLAQILLTVSGKVMDALTTLDMYLQYSPDLGTTWDDLAHFAQVTNAAIGDGKYIVWLNAAAAAAVDRAVTDGTLAANSVRGVHWGDRIRVKTVSANFAGTDTITIKLEGFFR